METTNPTKKNLRAQPKGEGPSQQFCIRAEQSGQGQRGAENLQTMSLPAHGHPDGVWDLGCSYPVTTWLRQALRKSSKLEFSPSSSLPLLISKSE